MSTQPPGPRTVHSWSLERLVFFSDAVFAIAITLLVLPLTEAHTSPTSTWDGSCCACGRSFSASHLSFAVISNYWVAHHRTVRHIVDARLVWLNLGFLLMIAFLPFPTAVLGEHGDTTPAAVLYAGAMSLTGFASAGAPLLVPAGRVRRGGTAWAPARTWRAQLVLGVGCPSCGLSAATSARRRLAPTRTHPAHRSPRTPAR
jgi:hypothetical protein